MQEHSARLSRFRKGWTGYEQRAGSRYAFTNSVELEVLSCVRGYHMCKDRWAAAVGELLTCSRKPTDASVRYAVAVIKEGTTTGHLLWKIFKVCSFFLRNDGGISGSDWIKTFFYISE